MKSKKEVIVLYLVLLFISLKQVHPAISPLESDSIIIFNNCTKHFYSTFSLTSKEDYYHIWVSNSDKSCAEASACWDDYGSLSFEFPSQLELGVEKNVSALQNDVYFYHIIFFTEVPGIYWVNATLKGDHVPDCDIDRLIRIGYPTYESEGYLENSTTDDTPQDMPVQIEENCADQGGCTTLEALCPMRCFKDLDCDDQELLTIDLCLNPGTCNSSCHYESLLEGMNQSQNSSADNDPSTLQVLKALFEQKEQRLSKEQLVSVLKDLINLSFISVNRSYVVFNSTSVDEVNGSLVKANGSTNITLRLINNNPFGFEDVVFRESLPKGIAGSMDNIEYRGFLVYSEDGAKLDFVIPSMNRSSSYDLNYVIKQALSEEEVDSIASSLAAGTPKQEDIQEFMRDQQTTMDEMTITKKIRVEDGKTSVEQTISPKKAMKDVEIYLTIPKCMAQTLNEVYFANKDYRIISDDPMVVWAFDEMASDVNLNYEVFKEVTDKDCLDQAVVLAVAKEIEDKIIAPKFPITSNTIIGLAIIIFVVLVTIFSKRLGEWIKPQESSIPPKKAVPEHLVLIANYIDNLDMTKTSLESIVHSLKMAGWTDEIILESLNHVKDQGIKDRINGMFQEKEK